MFSVAPATARWDFSTNAEKVSTTLTCFE